jgi:hypothetical protein
MPKEENAVLREAQTAFSDNAHSLLHFRSESQAEVGRAVKKRGLEVAPKTVNNIFEARFPSELRNYTAIAEHFGVPLWIMFIPKLEKEMLRGDGLARLVKLMTDYMDCSDTQRKEVEEAARVLARINKAR